jgi:putative DNA primase/helicase
MIAAVARVYRPGCKADNILILEGEQGIFKSTALEVLGMGYSKEIRVKLDDKDASDALHSGVWIAILSELDAFKATSRAEAVKAFVTMSEDFYRQSYGRTTQAFQRSMIFAATTNEESYLNDPTGNRRFWPVAVGDIDIPALRRDVEQLWAEARQAYLTGESWWIDTKEDRKLATIEQNSRLLPDSWESYVSQYTKDKEFISVNDLLENGLEMMPAQQSPPSVARVIRYLRREGFGMMIRNGQRLFGRIKK